MSLLAVTLSRGYLPSTLGESLVYAWLTVAGLWCLRILTRIIAEVIYVPNNPRRVTVLLKWSVIPLVVLTAVLARYSGLARPQRPLFHNEFRRALKAPVLPAEWRPCTGIRDSQYNFCYADFEFNILVLLTGFTPTELRFDSRTALS
jgi:hypothetical protein